jgi:hypothetical protein
MTSAATKTFTTARYLIGWHAAVRGLRRIGRHPRRRRHLSVLAYAVRRTRPRNRHPRAPGPQITDVVRMVVVEGMIPTLTGLSIGIEARWPRPHSDNPNLPVFRPAIP